MSRHETLFFFNDTPTTEIYTLSLHDALPILPLRKNIIPTLAVVEDTLETSQDRVIKIIDQAKKYADMFLTRSEEHTSELQSHVNIVCRLLLEKIKSS